MYLNGDIEHKVESMSLHIILGDIASIEADVIVNTANPRPIVGLGVDAAIYKRAGIYQLLKSRRMIGNIDRGDVKVTPAFQLHAKYIFHAVSTFWEGGNHGERQILQNCYSKALNLAKQLECKSIAFPLMATGTYGFPEEESIKIAKEEIEKFLFKDLRMEIFLVLYDQETYQLAQEMCHVLQVDEDKGSLNTDSRDDVLKEDIVPKKNVEIFISYNTEDKIYADVVREKLKAASLRVWMAPESIGNGSYAMQIMEAIRRVDIFLVLFSSNVSENVKNEIDRAFQRIGHGLEMIGFQLDNSKLDDDYLYYLCRQKIIYKDSRNLNERVDELVKYIQKQI